MRPIAIMALGRAEALRSNSPPCQLSRPSGKVTSFRFGTDTCIDWLQWFGAFVSVGESRASLTARRDSTPDVHTLKRTSERAVGLCSRCRPPATSGNRAEHHDYLEPTHTATPALSPARMETAPARRATACGEAKQVLRRGPERLSTDKRRRLDTAGDCMASTRRVGLLTFSINVTLDGCVDTRRESPTRRHAPSSPASWTRPGRCCGVASLTR